VQTPAGPATSAVSLEDNLVERERCVAGVITPADAVGGWWLVVGEWWLVVALAAVVVVVVAPVVAAGHCMR